MTRTVLLCTLMLCSCPLLIVGQERDPEEMLKEKRGKRGSRPLLLDEPLPPPPKGPVAYGGPMGGVVDIGRLREQLENSGVSRSVAEEIVSGTRDYLRTLQKKHIALRRLELDIREQMLEEQPKLKRIKSLIEAKMKVMGEIEYERIKRDVEIRKKLTEEQYEAWRSRVPGR